LRKSLRGRLEVFVDWPAAARLDAELHARDGVEIVCLLGPLRLEFGLEPVMTVLDMRAQESDIRTQESMRRNDCERTLRIRSSNRGEASGPVVGYCPACARTRRM